MGEQWHCEWCGAALEPLQTGWTDLETGSGEFCPEGQAVRDWGTSPHLPVRADLPDRAAQPAPTLPDCVCGHAARKHHPYSDRFAEGKYCEACDCRRYTARAASQERPQPITPPGIDPETGMRYEPDRDPMRPLGVAQERPSIDVERLRRIENALLRAAGYFPWEDPHGDAWIHENDEGYVMDREQAVNDALSRLSGPVGE